MPLWRSRPTSERRRSAHRRGYRGEALAALFLRLKLYSIRDRRFKTPVGEIDLVAEKAGAVIFVEVKTRGRNDEEAVALGAANTARIVRAAQYWLARHPSEANKDFRFDVIFLAPGRWPRHLINAFSAA